MDYQEVIELLKNANRSNDMVGILPKSDISKVIISAMQELQALHEQGFSLERLKDIDFRKDVIEHINYYTYMGFQEELEEYQQLGTLEEVREAVEKQRSKKIEVWNGQATCPKCHKLFGNMEDIKKLIAWNMPYCMFCGQNIDWSEEETTETYHPDKCHGCFGAANNDCERCVDEE